MDLKDLNKGIYKYSISIYDIVDLVPCISVSPIWSPSTLTKVEWREQFSDSNEKVEGSRHVSLDEPNIL